MSTHDQLPTPIESNVVDYVTATAKSILGTIPFAGSLLAEVAGSIIPNQRIDRIADFTAKLEHRIKSLEETFLAKALTDEEFTDLVEESLRQASRSTTQERRGYLAALVSNSLSSEEITYAETKHLMRILGELTDVEVVWLRSYIENNEFRELHSNVLDPMIPSSDSPPQGALDARVLRESYRDHLLRLGLVIGEIRKNKDGSPEFDDFSRSFKAHVHRISQLGRLLLKQIDVVGQDPQ